MQSGKNAAASAKETAGNVAASAKAGVEKTKAAVQGQVDKMTSHSPAEKEAAQHRKDERIHQAECNKQDARAQNAAEREATHAATGGTAGHPTGHGTGPTGHVASTGPGTTTTHVAGTNPTAHGASGGGSTF